MILLYITASASKQAGYSMNPEHCGQTGGSRLDCSLRRFEAPELCGASEVEEVHHCMRFESTSTWMDGANPPPLARHYLVGKRYLHGKNRFPVTLRYVGLLPPLRGSEAGGSSASSSSSTIATWLGVEYDDASQGKHSGTFEGISVFRTRQEGAGAFIRLKSGNELVEGLTFVLAVEERYGRISSSSSEPDAGPRDHADTASTDETSGGTQGHEQFLLGSSNQAIVVEAPGLAEVQKRIGKLERLREIGLDGAWSSSLGADEETKEALRARLKGRSRIFSRK